MQLTATTTVVVGQEVDKGVGRGIVTIRPQEGRFKGSDPWIGGQRCRKGCQDATVPRKAKPKLHLFQGRTVPDQRVQGFHASTGFRVADAFDFLDITLRDERGMKDFQGFKDGEFLQTVGGFEELSEGRQIGMRSPLGTVQNGQTGQVAGHASYCQDGIRL